MQTISMIVDSGASDHMVGICGLFCDMKHTDDKSVTIGDGRVLHNFRKGTTIIN